MVDNPQPSEDPTPLSVRSAKMQWSDDDGSLQVGNTHFALTIDPSDWNSWDSTVDQFVLLKSRHYLDSLLRFAPDRVDNIVDLGIFKGGSIALYEELFAPKKMLGVDLTPSRVEALDGYLARHQRADAVRLSYGTDQGDRGTLTRLTNETFGAEPLDLVVDDCSHMYELTKASLNALLPRVRPGGVYVIEDWGWAHYPGGSPANWQRNQETFKDQRTPMSKLILELVSVVASRPDLIREINVVPGLVFVTRGHASVSENGFDIDNFHSTPGRKLLYEGSVRSWWQRRRWL